METTMKKPVKKTAKVNSQEVVKTKDGISYVITGDNKVKKVEVGKSLSDLGKLLKQANHDAQHLMNTLHAFLRDKDDSVSRKKDFIECRMYRMGFTPTGFKIRDMKNFGKAVSDFDNPFPTPREVWEYISKPKVVIKPQPVAEKPKQPAAPSPVEEKKPEPKPTQDEMTTEDFEALRKKALKKIAATKKPADLVTSMAEYFPHRGFKVHFGKLKKELQTKKLRLPRFVSALTELVKTFDFSPKKKAPEKWWGISEFYKVCELERDGDNVHIVITDRPGKHTMNKMQFTAMYLLHKHQDLMPQMFKMLRGEITPEQFVAEPKKRDRFVEFDQKLLMTYNKEFNDAIDQVYQDYELPNPLRFAYKNNLHSPLKKGDKIVVLWLDYGAWYPATVTSTEFGIKLIYDDGNIMNLLSHQPWRK